MNRDFAERDTAFVPSNPCEVLLMWLPSVVGEQAQKLRSQRSLEVRGMLRCVLPSMLLHAAAVVLDQIVDRLHPALLRLGRVDSTGGDVLLLGLLLQLGLEPRQHD